MNKEQSMKIVATLIAIALVSAATLVLAQPAGAPEHGAALERLRAADTNGDGLISRAEAAASLPRIAKHFDEIDANKDGQLSHEELRAYHEAKKAERAKRKAEAGDSAPASK
jgi:Ca2+-binding EF-hand superfamily protein